MTYKEASEEFELPGVHRKTTRPKRRQRLSGGCYKELK